MPFNSDLTNITKDKFIYIKQIFFFFFAKDSPPQKPCCDSDEISSEVS